MPLHLIIAKRGKRFILLLLILQQGEKLQQRMFLTVYLQNYLHSNRTEKMQVNNDLKKIRSNFFEANVHGFATL